MKRSAGPALLGLLLVLAVPTALASPLDADLGLPVLGDGAGLSQIEATASAEADAATNATGPVAVSALPAGPGRADPIHATGTIQKPSIDVPEAAAAAGAALGLALLVWLLHSGKGWLLGALAFPFFSRIDANRILDNDVRSRVHEAILQNPGITIKEVTRVLGIGWGTAIYHLKRLESERLVVSERHRQFRRYFKNGGGIVNDAKTAFSELKNPTTHRIATALLKQPGAAQKELCEAIGISAPLAHKYLARMEEAHLLTRQREWKTVKYFPTGRLAELLAPPPSAVLIA